MVVKQVDDEIKTSLLKYEQQVADSLPGKENRAAAVATAREGKEAACTRETAWRFEDHPHCDCPSTDAPASATCL